MWKRAAVTDYYSSKQLLLFVFTGQYRHDDDINVLQEKMVYSRAVIKLYHFKQEDMGAQCDPMWPDVSEAFANIA